MPSSDMDMSSDSDESPQYLAAPSAPVDTSKWPLLLKNYADLITMSDKHQTLGYGSDPERRTIEDHLTYGILNVDKPSNTFVGQMATWVRQILCVDKTADCGQLGVLDSGVTLICLGRTGGLLKVPIVEAFVMVFEFVGRRPTERQIRNQLDTLTGDIFQSIAPGSSGINQYYRTCRIIECQLAEYKEEELQRRPSTGRAHPPTGRALIVIACAGRVSLEHFCVQLGNLLGVEGYLAEARRVQAGPLGEQDNMVNMFDVLDAQWLYKTYRDESYLRLVVRPIESALVGLKRLVVRDSSVGALCDGSPLFLGGLLRYDPSIDLGDLVVFITTKGEAIALGRARMSTADLTYATSGRVADVKHGIMGKGVYPLLKGDGPHAVAPPAGLPRPSNIPNARRLQMRLSSLIPTQMGGPPLEIRRYTNNPQGKRHKKKSKKRRGGY